MQEVEKPSVDNLKIILISLITNTAYLKQFIDRFSEQSLNNTSADVIKKWCIKVYTQVNEAPNANIQLIYDMALQSNKYKPEVLDSISLILKSLNNTVNTTQYNTDMLMEITSEYLNHLKVNEVKDGLSRAIDAKDTESALKLLEGFKKISKGVEHPLIDISNESMVLDRLYNNEEGVPVVNIDGHLGGLINPYLVKGGTVAVRGVAKGKKSFFCNFLAVQALLQGKHVVMFQTGDLTEFAALSRFYSALANKPFKKHTKPVKVPVFDCWLNQTNTCTLINRCCKVGCLDELNNPIPAEKISEEYTPCSICKLSYTRDYPYSMYYNEYVATSEVTVDTVKMINKRIENSKGSFRLYTYSPMQINVGGIESILDSFIENKEQFPDVVIIDHEKLLSWEKGSERDPEYQKVERRWAMLRRLSTKFNFLLLVADQTRGRIENKDGIQTSDDYSGSVAKNQCVTGVITLNAGDDFRTQRVGITNGRTTDDDSFCIITQDLNKGQVVLDSYIPTPRDLKSRERFIKKPKETKYKKR